MRTEDPRPIKLVDYQPPAFLIDEVHLTVELDPAAEATRVTGELKLRRNPSSADPRAPLVLDGEKLKLQSVHLNGEVLSANQYLLDEEHLTLPEVPDGPFTVTTEALISPKDNTALNGLYFSDGIFCTQCEPEGFRRITYYLDRPDVMASFRTRIIGASDATPVLLSNGNLEASGTLEDGRHYAEWHDPFLKPAYLFALVAGRLGHIEDKFVTRSGRDVTLQIYVEPGNEARAHYAMDALKRSMKWDEERFGREYDLDIFMIVAVSTFNMGAMENKGLNVFNDKFILASPETATDADYAGIESVIAHEYFHNWTGNRITCRDWFQLCLKEGLTVFRDQEFTSDMRSRPVKRIADVRGLRGFQFPEDQGPLAHPVRPSSYIEINNFYTATVYEKGAEICRMMYTLTGREGFRAGMDTYFERHDGEAATVEDFVHAIGDGAGQDLTPFLTWYAQAGTPDLTATARYDSEAKSFELQLTQNQKPTPGQTEKKPLPIPVAVGLIGPDGQDMPLKLAGEANVAPETTKVLLLNEREQSFRFEGIEARPVPSILRGFSAPVTLHDDLSEEDRVFLMIHDSDPFNQWEAMQRYATRAVTQAIASGEAPTAGAKALAEAFRLLLEDPQTDADYAAQALLLPSEIQLAQSIGENVDPQAVHDVRETLRHAIAAEIAPSLHKAYESHRLSGPYRPEAEDAGHRALRNVCLGYLAVAPAGAIEASDGIALAKRQFDEADNMTDEIAALGVLSHFERPERSAALSSFYEQWQGDHLVMDKWFSLQAMSMLDGTLDEVKALTRHPLFNLRNPNRVRAVIGAFASGNPLHFHRKDGSGYRFITDKVLEIDPLNPQLAARLLNSFRSWRQMEPGRRALMREQLERVAGTEPLSRDVYEIATKTLAD